MNIKLLLAGILAAAGAVGVVQLAGMPKLRYTVHVVGEDGQPIAGATAEPGFNPDAFGFGKSISTNVTTDENGNFTVEGYSESGVPEFHKSIGKDGYYDSGFSVGTFHAIKDGEWQPWDQIYTTVLRKIGNPVSMYAYRMEGDIPAVGMPCGFDLEETDWVAPYGKGTTTDIIVTLTSRVYNGFGDFDVSTTITFPNEGDGIQSIQLPKEFSNSHFKWPREAPETGYQSKLELQNALFPSAENKPPINTWKSDQAYFFRVRTVKQNGQIVSALYGKISGGIVLEPRGAKICDLGIIYYLNPTSLDRNLEYSGITLFKNFSAIKNPREP